MSTAGGGHVIISTQTAKELGWGQLPSELVRATGDTDVSGKIRDIRERRAYANAVKAMAKAYPNVTHVLNAKIEFHFEGHPSNYYTYCTITGDGYTIATTGEVSQPVPSDRGFRQLQF